MYVGHPHRKGDIVQAAGNTLALREKAGLEAIQELRQYFKKKKKEWRSFTMIGLSRNPNLRKTAQVIILCHQQNQSHRE